ncbi:MAG: arsinothricin resistance N-acetyltransferase ArsN1 [Gammaproteobacteria bacterium]|nr:arsinothricin resistance N-acetyltransferase ArsN1 [Gammaproteobacteria bacterium]
MKTRLASPEDVASIARIYNQGIEDRLATFETRARTTEDIKGWFSASYTVIVVEDAGLILAFSAIFPYAQRECYAGVREFSVYVSRDHRGKGVGRIAMEALMAEARKQGVWKLLSRVFPENEQSLRLLGSLGFRRVGTYEKHAQLDGEWRDVVIIEYLV